MDTIVTTNIKHDRDTGEYIVKLFFNGTHQEKADYFTDDLADAKTTGQAMIAHAKNWM